MKQIATDKIYDYRRHEAADIEDWIEDSLGQHDLALLLAGDPQTVNATDVALWSDDAVTGNGSGSYTFDRLKAERYLYGNWELLADASQEFDVHDVLDKGAEYCDVLVRTYLFQDCYEQALSNLREKYKAVSSLRSLLAKS